MQQAVAVDLGATSGRFALGRLSEGRIEFEVIRQIPHAPRERGGRLEWDLETILGLCRDAVALAAERGASTIGIDSWGVDHGFIGPDGQLMATPVCYRDHSHERAFTELEPHRDRLYELTGIQHQPFNTVCQLLARRTENPDLPRQAREWMILPDLLGYLLGGGRNMELTQASTTQLLGLDGKWSAEAFELIGWPVPQMPAMAPGHLGGEVCSGVRLAHVGSHDTASAVAGFGELANDELFVNVGTWSLVGGVVPEPVATPESAAGNWTNERTVDGRVRLLKNVPGFYVINRIHEELGIASKVPEWLDSAESVDERVDLLRPEFFNPESMVETVAQLAGRRPKSEAEWAGLALASLTSTLARQPEELGRLTGRTFRRFRVAGGGSQSKAFCQSLADESGLPVLAGPAEATVLGNLGLQFLAGGALGSFEEMYRVLSASAGVREFGRR